MQAMLDWTWGDINNGDVGPGAFSWFHLLWLGIMIAACIVIGLTVARKHSDKADRVMIGIFAVILIGCEVYKQLFWFEFYGYYRFEIFPYQFCSVPIYVAIAASVIPFAKARELCYRFLAFFGIIGGLAVMVVPSAPPPVSPGTTSPCSISPPTTLPSSPFWASCRRSPTPCS